MPRGRGRAPFPMRDFTVVALIAAYNEADIVGQVVGDLIAQGVSVYFIDDGSTDGTVAAVEPYVGRGVLAIERVASPPGDGLRYDWTALLRRKEALSQELDADWFIHHDADEFRESPWAGTDLRSAIRQVDALGYNAIDFSLLDFWPTDGDLPPGSDVRAAFPYCEPGQPYNRVQVRCWKKTSAAMDLVSSGGHEAAFDGRRVFPIRFLLRHYPIRGQAHGERKVFADRLPRFADRERQLGWHVQYDTLAATRRFVRSASELTRYDAGQARARLQIENRLVEETARERDRLAEAFRAQEDVAHRLGRDLEALHARVEALQQELSQRHVALRRREKELEAVQRSLAETRARVDALESSWSWRLTGPGRRLVTWVSKERG